MRAPKEVQHLVIAHAPEEEDVLAQSSLRDVSLEARTSVSVTHDDIDRLRVFSENLRLGLR